MIGRRLLLELTQKEDRDTGCGELRAVGLRVAIFEYLYAKEGMGEKRVDKKEGKK